VTDTGIGIAERDRERIFGSFIQHSAQHNKKYGGTGLGLAVSKGLMDMMGGQILLESQPGEGSTFTLLFPEIPYKVMEFSREPKAPASDKKHTLQGRVLVVDDVELNRNLLKDFLTKLGISVETAVSGQEAVDLCGSGDYHLILMDISMPEMDGYEATEKIRQIPGQKQVPVVALTAAQVDETSSRGFDDLVTKPFSLKTLEQTLVKYLATPES